MNVSICLLFCYLVCVQSSLGTEDNFVSDAIKVLFGEGKIHKDSYELNIKSDTQTDTDNSVVIGDDIRASENQKINIGNDEDMESQIYRTNGNDIKRNMEQKRVSEAKLRAKRSNVHIDTQNKEYKDNIINLKGDNLYRSADVILGTTERRSKRSTEVEAGNGANDRIKRNASVDYIGINSWKDVGETKCIWFYSSKPGCSPASTTDSLMSDVLSKRNVEVEAATGASDRSKRCVFVNDDKGLSKTRCILGLNSNPIRKADWRIYYTHGVISKRSVEHEAVTSNDRIKRGVWDVKEDAKNPIIKDNGLQVRMTWGKTDPYQNCGRECWPIINRAHIGGTEASYIYLS